MDDAIIVVPDHVIVADLDVTVDITHTSVFDLQLRLVGPSGDTCWLNFYNPFEFFPGQDYAATVFDDEAPVPIQQAVPPFAGRFTPRTPLAVFDGCDASGRWRLQVNDTMYADSGLLNSFGLTITATTPEPPTLLCFGLALFLTFRFSKPPRHYTPFNHPRPRTPPPSR